MLTTQEQALNTFFVETFNQILSWEERTFAKTAFRNLSVREFHILEAVGALEQTKANTMTQIAARLNVSVGALTTAVNALVRKGYLRRQGSDEDRRLVLVYLTESGRQADMEHALFHREMVQSVVNYLTKEQLDALIVSLNRLNDFFKGKIEE